MTKNKKTPMRMCVGCRTMKDKNELLRIVRLPDGTVINDLTKKASGRGAYLCKNGECLKKSIRSNALSRALSTEIDQCVVEALEKEINE